MKPILLIAGCGPSGRALANRCLPRWSPTVIDNNQKNLDALGNDEIETILGDCTSTLVLKKSPLSRAGAAVATTGDDEVNFEFCRLARELYSVRECIAVVHDQEAAEKFKEAGFKALSRPAAVGAIVESQLDSGRRTATGIGLGIGEIMEVTVQANSPVIGKTLRQLRPQAWLLAAIYRDGELVVPHGTTEILENDKCLLTGDPLVLPDICEYFQRGSSEFPLQFGTRYGIVDSGDQKALDEAKYLLENTNASGLRILTPPRKSSSLSIPSTDGSVDISTYALDAGWPNNLTEVGDTLDLACLVVSPEKVGWLQKYGLKSCPLDSILEQTSEPVLMARETTPYKKILLAVSPAVASMRAAELAVDVARKFEASLTVVAACPAEMVSGESFREEADEAMQRARGLASLYGLDVETELLEGNPVRQICLRSEDFDLLIVAHRRERKFSLLKSDVSKLIAIRASCSTMVLPYRNDDLGRSHTESAGDE